MGSVLSNIFGTNSTTNSSASTNVTTPDALQPLLAQSTAGLQQTIADPMASIAPLEGPAIEQVNQNYAGADQAIRDRFLSSGTGGNSGKSGTAETQTQLQRIGAISGLQGQFANMALNQQNNAQSLAEKLLQAESGSSSSGTSNTQTSGLGSLLGGGLGAAASLFALNSGLGAPTQGEIDGATGVGGYMGSGGPAGPALPPNYSGSASDLYAQSMGSV